MLDTPEIKDMSSSAQLRAKRLEITRLMTGLTRKACEEKYGICASTINLYYVGDYVADIRCSQQKIPPR